MANSCSFTQTRIPRRLGVKSLRPDGTSQEVAFVVLALTLLFTGLENLLGG